MPLTTTSKIKSAIQIIVGSHVVAGGLATYHGNDTWYRRVIMPTIHLFLNPEKAHKAGVWMASKGLVPRVKVKNYPSLHNNLWGLEFKNPLGLAAGFDKDGEAVTSLLRLGFGFVEVGSITPEPQEGNPKPRVFRLSGDQAIINRYGFNSIGHEMAYNNIKNQNKSNGVLGINLGKNKTSPEESDDYSKGILKFNELADYIVINISSPNTPGLRDLQGKINLKKLLDNVNEVRLKLPANQRKPLLLKLSPDLNQQQKKDIADVIIKQKNMVDGLIISNTTVDRSMNLNSTNKNEIGGLSGAPLKDKSTQLIKDMYLLTSGKIPIVGVGGVSSGEDAYNKIKAGASLIQLYSALVYQGPCLVKRISQQLADLLEKDNVKNIKDVIGIDARNSK